MDLETLDPRLSAALKRFCYMPSKGYPNLLPKGPSIVDAGCLVVPFPFGLWEEEYILIAKPFSEVGPYVWVSLDEGIPNGPWGLFLEEKYRAVVGYGTGGIEAWLDYADQKFGMMSHAAYFLDSGILHYSLGDISQYFVVRKGRINDEVWLKFWREFAKNFVGADENSYKHFLDFHASCDRAAPLLSELGLT